MEGTVTCFDVDTKEIIDIQHISKCSKQVSEHVCVFIKELLC